MGQPQVFNLSQAMQFDKAKPVSKLLHDSDNTRVVLFCFEAGQKLAEHESTSEVVFYGVQGRSKIVIGGEHVILGQQSFVVCPPNVPHGIIADERAVVLATIAPRP